MATSKAFAQALGFFFHFFIFLVLFLFVCYSLLCKDFSQNKIDELMIFTRAFIANTFSKRSFYLNFAL